MKKLLLSLWTILAIVLSFNGCGSGESGSSTYETENIISENEESLEIKELGSKDNPITLESELVEIYNTLSPIIVKNEYETETEYSSRIESYSNTAELIYFETDVDSKYDVETQTLYLYDDFVTNENILVKSPGFFSSYYIKAYNMNATSYPVYSISGYKDDNIRLFYKATVSPEAASMKENYYNLYKAVVGIKLVPSIDFSSSSYNSFSGRSYSVNGSIVYLKVYNRITSEVYREDNFTIDVLDRFKRENSVVIDNAYMLMWQDDSISDKMTWNNAKSYCENLTLNDYNDWYLPNQSQLSSLVKYQSKSGGGIDYTKSQTYDIFENITNEIYFTSTEYPYGYSAEVISFHNGYDFLNESIYNELRVKCVRNMW